jgi:hypothetical protein
MSAQMICVCHAQLKNALTNMKTAMCAHLKASVIAQWGEPFQEILARFAGAKKTLDVSPPQRIAAMGITPA